ncbi:hypothetical protein D3C87_908410 [compost metagenome]
MAKEKLKPCPFCGSHPVHGLMKVEYCQLHGEPFQRARVNCPHGHAEIICSSLAEAKKKWNRRPAYPGETGVALDKAMAFIESLIDDPLLMADDIEMTLDDVQNHARIELASLRTLMKQEGGE